LAAGAARDGFAAGFRVAALFLLLAVPFAFALRRPPAAAHAAAGAADAGPPAEAEAVPATQRA
jgi:hypothetical protein